jgi:uncharacterized membrane-anchored protein
MSSTRLLIIVGAVLVLGAVNFSILGKERIKQEGTVVYLDLAPVDPRSIMQGDYMTLRFRLAQDIQATVKALPAEGDTALAPVNIAKDRVGNLARAGEQGDVRIRYRMRKGAVWLGTNAFFFEEGKDAQYAAARFGEFRVDPASGEAVLVGLRDANLKALTP